VTAGAELLTTTHTHGVVARASGDGGPRVGLALAGGVVEGGFYEVGVLCALEESVAGLDLGALDTYVGVSSGALIASLLANGVSPRLLSQAVVGRAGPTLDLSPELLFDVAWRDHARRLLGAPALAAGMLRRFVARPMDESPYGLVMELGAALPPGLFAGEAIERYLARALGEAGRTDDFRRLGGRLRVVAVDLDTSAVVDFGGDSTAHVPISRAVRASIALPGLYQPVEIEGRHYIDGVARRTMHASVALKQGVDLLLCINPIVPVELRGEGAAEARGPLVRHGLPAVLSQTFRTLVHSRLTTAFEHYAHAYPATDIVLIEPDMKDHRLFFSNIFSFSNRRGVTEHAYQSTRRWLRAGAAALGPVLARHGLALRDDVLADETRTLYPERRVEQRAERTAGAARSAFEAPTVEATGLGAVLGRLDAVLDRVAAAVAVGAR
jgi:predicted acylesterase/phospholipase RssA